MSNYMVRVKILFHVPYTQIIAWESRFCSMCLETNLKEYGAELDLDLDLNFCLLLTAYLSLDWALQSLP